MGSHTLFLFVLGADCVKALLKPRYTTCIALPTAIVHRVSHLVREGKEVGHHPLPSVNLCCLLPSHLLAILIQENGFYNDLLHNLPRIQGEPDWPGPGSLLPSCGGKWYLPFSGDQESLLTTMNYQRGLAVTLNCSFSTLGLIHSSPWSSVCPSGLSDP